MLSTHLCSSPEADDNWLLHSFPTRRSSDLITTMRLPGWMLGLGTSWRSWRRRAKPKTRLFLDRKSTRLNSSHVAKSYAVFCLKTNILSIIAIFYKELKLTTFDPVLADVSDL